MSNQVVLCCINAGERVKESKSRKVEKSGSQKDNPVVETEK